MKELKVWIDESGRKQKTEGLSINQNSYGNKLVLYTVGVYEVIDVFFKRPDGKMTPKYHMVYDGTSVSEDDGTVETGYAKWEFTIPYAVTSFTIASSSAKMDCSFACYYRNASGQQLSPTVANSVISVTKSSNSDVLDDSYNGIDVQNLWSAVGDNGYKIQDLSENKVDKTTTVNGQGLSQSIILNAGEIPYASDADTQTTKAKVDALQTKADSNSQNIADMMSGTDIVAHATLAEKARSDANGNVITTTYETITNHNADILNLENADSTLQNNMNAELAARTAADTTLQTNITAERNTRISDVSNLQSQIDATNATQNVIDIVATKADLDGYNKSLPKINDKIEVMADESQNGSDTIYRWDGSKWSLIGSKAVYYSKSESDDKFETINAHNLDRGHIYQIDLTGTLASGVITFELTNAADEITLVDNQLYELDLLFPAAGTLTNDEIMRISYGSAPIVINLTNILNSSGTMLVRDMKQLEKYSDDYGWRWITHAVYNSANGQHYFSIPSTVVRADILAMSDADLATHIADADLEKGQLVFVSKETDSNGFYLGHTYQVDGATITDVTSLYKHLSSNTTATTASISLSSGIEYRYGTLTSLTVASVPTDINNFHSVIQFSSGSTATTVSFPTGTKFVGMHTDATGSFIPRPSTSYLLSLRNDGSGNLLVMVCAY
jgi:hypothetical protein